MAGCWLKHVIFFVLGDVQRVVRRRKCCHCDWNVSCGCCRSCPSPTLPYLSVLLPRARLIRIDVAGRARRKVVQCYFPQLFFRVRYLLFLFCLRFCVFCFFFVLHLNMHPSWVSFRQWNGHKTNNVSLGPNVSSRTVFAFFCQQFGRFKFCLTSDTWQDTSCKKHIRYFRECTNNNARWCKLDLSANTFEFWWNRRVECYLHQDATFGRRWGLQYWRRKWFVTQLFACHHQRNLLIVAHLCLPIQNSRYSKSFTSR